MGCGCRENGHASKSCQATASCSREPVARFGQSAEPTMISDVDYDKMLRTISSRPRMYCSTIETGRELIFFLRGVSAGAVYSAHAPQGEWDNEKTLAFREYVYRRFHRVLPWPGFWRCGEFESLLLEEFGEKPFGEVYESIGKLLRGIQDEAPELDL